jgi:HAD superfamily hydrolase (TIGR01509 family)
LRPDALQRVDRAEEARMNRITRRGLFFDLDGTLADSSAAMRQVFRDFAASFGRETTEADYDALHGSPVPIIITKLKRAWALPQKPAELLERYNQLIDAAFSQIPPTPGASATIEAACAHGWKVGVVTSNTAARSRAWLARRGLASFVEIVVGGDEVCLGKPQPEPYRVALARSGCARETSIAIEDSLAGARSALAAGLRTFGYAPPDREAIDWPESVRLINAFDELLPEFTRPRSRRVAGRR